MYKINSKKEKNLGKYKNMFFSISCLAILSLLMITTATSPEDFKSSETVAPLKIYEEENKVAQIEVNFSCLDLEKNKIVDIKEKVNLDKYIQNPEQVLITEYFNYVGDNTKASPICNKIKIDTVVLDKGVLKVDLLEVGEPKYQGEMLNKVSKFSNDLKKLALAQTLKQLKNVEKYEITLNGDELEILSYIEKVTGN